MKLIVGLGNPGRKYEGTRHNIGFLTIAELSRRQQARLLPRKFDCEIAEAQVGEQRVLLLCPQSFMNLSGQCVRPATDFYKLPLEQLLVVCDDFNLPLEQIRLRARGSAGGQNGLKSIIRHLGTEEFCRLRIGIGPVPDRWDPADYVLGRFSREERKLLPSVIERAADAALCWLTDGIERAMNQFN